MLELWNWLRATFNNWRFYRAMGKAPVTKLGELFVKEVGGNLYAVDAPKESERCRCFQCEG